MASRRTWFSLGGAALVVLFCGACSKSGGESLEARKGGGHRTYTGAASGGKTGGRSVPSGSWREENGAVEKGHEGAGRGAASGSGGEPPTIPPAAGTGRTRGGAPGSDIDEGRRHGTKN